MALSLPTIKATTATAAVAYSLLHMAQGWFLIFPSGQMKNFHVGFAILLTLLWLWDASRTKAKWAYLLAIIVVVAVIGYVHIEYESLIQTRPFFPNQLDLIAGASLLALALFVVWREWGYIVPLLVLAVLAYAYFGPYMPGDLLFHGGIGMERLIGYTSIPFFQGLFGSLTELSAGTIFMYLLFAGLLTATGGVKFIIDVAFAIAGRSQGGPAQVAVIASSLLGMLSGSSVANVASTGAFTIPLMKRVGFRPHFAAAVEAVASTGGQIAPPVLGLAAFLIVGITGIPYVDIVVASVAPALMFYIYLLFYVRIRAAKADLKVQEFSEVETVHLGRSLIANFHLLLAIAILIGALLNRTPPGYAALYGVLSIIGLEAVKALVVHRNDLVQGARSYIATMWRGLEHGGRSGAQVAVIVALIGLIADLLAVTGFAQKLSFSMLELSSGNMYLLLLIAGLTCLLFGLGLPTAAAYILVALLGAPAMVEYGIPILAAHFFVFYLANFSAITPPVALSVLVASNIAGSSFMRSALASLRLGLPGFLLPFLFVLRPEILGIDATLVEQVMFVALGTLALLSVGVILEGHLLVTAPIWQRIALLPSAFGLLHEGIESTLVGLFFAVVVVTSQIVSWKRTRTR